MAATMSNSKVNRLTLDEMDHLSTGKKTRLHRLMYEHGPGNGTLLFLPIDQGLEHGPVDFFDNPPAADPDFQAELALRGNYSAIVYHIGLAEKHMKKYAGRVPLVLKLNGKTCIPSDDEAFSPLTGSVQDAIRLGADAVGYTIYVGSPAQDRDIAQFNEVRREAEKYGMPVIVWSYPRGAAIGKKGGKDSLYAIDYAARVASELGADVVKINYPKGNPTEGSPAPYNTMQISNEEATRKVVQSAGKSLVVFSGGSKVGDDELFNMARMAMNSGAAGLIFGRNMWQRPMEEAIEVSRKASEILRNS